MNINFKKSWVIAKINFRYSKLTYIITAVTVLAGTSNLIQYLVFHDQSSNRIVDSANYLYLALILAPIFIPALNFRKIMHLNGKKFDFYWGALINYGIIAAVVSLANIILFFDMQITLWLAVKHCEFSAGFRMAQSWRCNCLFTAVLFLAFSRDFYSHPNHYANFLVWMGYRCRTHCYY